MKYLIALSVLCLIALYFNGVTLKIVAWSADIAQISALKCAKVVL